MNGNPRLVFFAGKGGVGKTTSASAYALSAPGRGRVLIVSTDPAHSLGDVLGVRLSSTPKGIAPRLDALELDAPRAFGRWLREHRPAIGEILEHGTWLDASDIDALLALSIPGVDELAGFLEIARLADALPRTRGSRRAQYDLVVVDTAPTGHILRLLGAPDTVAAVAAVFDALQREHRLIRDQLARVGGRPEVADRLIALLARQAHDTSARLQDAAQTSFHWVTLPEEMSLAESDDAIGALDRAGMHVSHIVVNNVLPDGDACPLCDRRRAEQRRVIALIRRRFGWGRTMRLVTAQVREPRGLRALKALVRTPSDGSPSGGRARRPIAAVPASRPGEAFAIRRQQPSRGAAPDAMRSFRGASLLFFGGKGGVGKTTVSAVAALQLAREDPVRRVLLLSTDPAHSLADVFGASIGDTPGTIFGAPRNLDLRELDAARAFAQRREQIEAALDEIAATTGAGGGAESTAGITMRGPSSAASQLINLAPPGIDELFGILSILDVRSVYGLVVVDTAPTGHALRLLEMPDAARDWTQVLLRMLLKYRALVRPGRLAEELVAVSKSIRALQTLLHDAARTRFIVVTRAAGVPMRETRRLLARLRRLRLAAPAVVVNALTLPPGRCRRCRSTAVSEARELAALRRLCVRRCAIIRTPLVAPPPRGTRALSAWGRTWTTNGG